MLNTWSAASSASAFASDTWDNRDGPGGVGSTSRGLTHSSYRREGVSSMVEEPRQAREQTGHTP